MPNVVQKGVAKAIFVLLLLSPIFAQNSIPQDIQKTI